MEITNEIAYLIGLAQTDGHLQKSSRNRGKFTIELSSVDKDIIEKIASIIPYNYTIFQRERKTNFSNKAKTIGIRVCNEDFRQWLVDMGVPYGRKSKIISPPYYINKNNIKDYIRGLWDGDGSLCFSKDNKPLMGFTTQSEEIKKFLKEFIDKTCNNHNHNFSKPKRDDCFNILISVEDAVKLVNAIYPDNCCIVMNRKYKIANEIKLWSRSEWMKNKIYKIRHWSKEDDDFIMSHTVGESSEKFGKTKQCIYARRDKIKNIR